MNHPRLPEDYSRSDATRWVCSDACEAGWVTLVPYDELRLERFSMDCQSTLVEAADPHRGKLGCYLVPAVNLTREAEHYDGVGLLLWLPEEQRYATWDASHPAIYRFAADVTWTAIAADPAHYINAQWAIEGSAPTEPLEPWHRYSYSPQQFYEPQPM